MKKISKNTEEKEKGETEGLKDRPRVRQINNNETERQLNKEKKRNRKTEGKKV